MSTPTAEPAVSLWRNRPFRSFWLGETISQFGDRRSYRRRRTSTRTAS